MSTNDKVSTDISDFPIFGDLPFPFIREKCSAFLNTVKNIALSRLGKNWNDFLVDREAVFEIISLVEKRRVYFKVFHGKTLHKVGELNEVCLYAFWILKFNPFSVGGKIQDINVVIAIYLLFWAVLYTAKQRGVSNNITTQTFDKLFHAFKYQDLSKEAIMLLGESLLGT
ncbi:MAG: hypothetical protein LBN42_02350 [Oscillospiraceae bacterium]|jgi:hypothetical protein|nr:hypothetical protein [Oscillospiraceae bacterium]